MSNGAKASLRNTQRSFSGRLDGLEQNFTRFLIGVNNRVQNHEQRLSNLEEKVEALIELNGPVEVEAAVNRLRLERSRAEVAIEKAKLDEAIADGYVMAVEKVEERSLVVGRYLDETGTVVEPGRLQIPVPTVKAEFKDQLIGASVGAVIDLQNGTKFELTEIYNVDEAKAQEVAAAKQKTAEDAAQAIAAAEGTEPPAADEPAAEAEQG